MLCCRAGLQRSAPTYTGSGSALVALRDNALYKYTFTLLYFNTHCYWSSKGSFNFPLHYLVQLSYLGKLSSAENHEFSLKLLIFRMLQITVLGC